MSIKFERESSLIYSSSNELYENKILLNANGSNLVLNILRVSFCLVFIFISNQKILKRITAKLYVLALLINQEKLLNIFISKKKMH
jgi:hypothetical protein